MFLSRGKAVCAHPLAMPLLQPFLGDDAVSDKLQLFEFGAKAMAKLLAEILPAQCATESMVGWGGEVGAAVSEAWLGQFYRWFAKLNDKNNANPASLAAFAAFTLLPVHTTTASGMKESNLLACKHAGHTLRRTLKPASSGAGQQVESMGSDHVRVLDLLGRVGVPLLQEGFHVPQYVGVPMFTPQSSLEVLTSIMALPQGQPGQQGQPGKPGKKGRQWLRFDRLSGEEIDWLLEFYASAGLARDHLNLLKRLPIFELSHSTKASPRFITIADKGEEVRLLPEFAPPVKLNGIFLKNKPSVERLYTTLGIIPQPKTEMYLLHVFPLFATMGDADILRHMSDVRACLLQLCAEDDQFMRRLHELEWVRIGDRLLSCPNMYDPSQRMFKDFFPSRTPPAKFQDWIPFMYELGLQKEIGREQILECGVIAADNGNHTQARNVLRYVVENMDDLTEGETGEVDAWLDQLTGLKLAATYDGDITKPSYYMSTGKSKRPLIPLRDVVPKELMNLCFTTLPVLDVMFSTLHGGKYVTVEKKDRLGKLLRMKRPNLGHVLDHVVNVSAMRFPNADRVEAAQAKTNMRSSLAECYEKIIQGMEKHGGLVKDKLAGKRWVLLDASYSVKHSSALEFATTSEMFLELKDAIPGYAYHYSMVDMSLLQYALWSHLAQLTGVQKRPALQDVARMLASVSAGAGEGGRLKGTDLDLVVSMLNCTPPGASAEAKGKLLAPDHQGVMRPLNTLVLNDAPWLANRIDLDKLPVAHQKLCDVTTVLRVTPLSESVYASPAVQFHPNGGQFDSVRLSARTPRGAYV